MQASNNQIEQQKTPAYTQHIINQLPNDRNVYLIFDTARFDALNLVFASGQQTDFNMLYHDTDLQDQLKISPIIVKYSNYLQSKYNEWQHNAIAFTTTTNLIDTSNHLKSLVYCKMPNTQPAFFRFYAQTWLEPLLTGQKENDLYNFTGPIDNWFIPIEDGQWQQITVTQQTPSKTAKDHAWFNLTEELQEKLAEHSYQKFIDELTIRYTSLSLDTPEGQSFRSEIKKYVEQAKSYAIEQRDHITQYVDLVQCYPINIEDDQATVILANQYDTPANRLEQLTQYLREPHEVKALPNEGDQVALQTPSTYPTSL